MYIYKAILKHGHSNFSLSPYPLSPPYTPFTTTKVVGGGVIWGMGEGGTEILEYCEPSKVLEREQYYIDLLKPEYNILKTAGLGNTHSSPLPL